jgi:virulence-associated protein VapD
MSDLEKQLERLGFFFKDKQDAALRVVFESATRANRKYGSSITYNDLKRALTEHGLSEEYFDAFVRATVPRYRLSARVNGWTP